MSKTNIYILRLEGGKYYIGKSDNPMSRYKEHLTGNGSAWTRQHRPVEVLKIIEGCSNFDEDKYTKEYMAKYGIDNVRGGTYVSIKLDNFQREALTQEIWASQNKCTRCGRGGHFIKDCFASSDINGNELVEEYVWTCEKCDAEFSTERDCVNHERGCKRSTAFSSSKSFSNNICFRCGKYGHFASDCYVNLNRDKKHMYYYDTSDSDSDY
jgi:predicted GIY-YIG superfamily endonuclease